MQKVCNKIENYLWKGEKSQLELSTICIRNSINYIFKK